MSPYARARTEYGKEIKDLRKPSEKLGVVEARTVDTAQGHEADVCIVDLVRDYCTPHIEDSNRLCVMLTRARQMELIIVSEEMLESIEDMPHKTPNMDNIIDYCKEKGQFVLNPRTPWK